MPLRFLRAGRCFIRDFPVLRFPIFDALATFTPLRALARILRIGFFVTSFSCLWVGVGFVGSATTGFAGGTFKSVNEFLPGGESWGRAGV